MFSADFDVQPFALRQHKNEMQIHVLRTHPTRRRKNWVSISLHFFAVLCIPEPSSQRSSCLRKKYLQIYIYLFFSVKLFVYIVAFWAMYHLVFGYLRYLGYVGEKSEAIIIPNEIWIFKLVLCSLVFVLYLLFCLVFLSFRWCFVKWIMIWNII